MTRHGIPRTMGAATAPPEDELGRRDDETFVQVAFAHRPLRLKPTLRHGLVKVKPPLA